MNSREKQKGENWQSMTKQNKKTEPELKDADIASTTKQTKKAARENRKADILRTASRLFYAKGLHKVGVEEIVLKAGVTKPTLYYHYKNKDGLIIAYLESQSEAINGFLKDAFEQAEGDFAARVQAVFHALEKRAEHPKWHGCPFLRVMAEYSGNQNSQIIAIAREHKLKFEQWLCAQCIADGHRDPEHIAALLCLLVEGTLTKMHIHKSAHYAREGAHGAQILLNA